MMFLTLSSMDSAPLPFEVEPSAGNHLAWMNEILGLQRTLMAAERTAVTLIAFGFTVAQVFQNLGTIVPPQFLVLGPHLPRNVGLLIIAAGVGSLALFTWQYLRAVKYLGNGRFAAISVPPPDAPAPPQLPGRIRDHAYWRAGLRFGVRDLLKRRAAVLNPGV